MARHDALTNLPNRVLFRDKMEQALGRGERLAVMFLCAASIRWPASAATNSPSCKAAPGRPMPASLPPN
jgi:hypothetical protein